MTARSTRRGLLALIGLLVLGCSKPNQYVPPPPPSVTVAKPIIQTVTNYLEETGTTEAAQLVEIRARVRGFLEEIKFQDGMDVEAGESLYLIQPREFKAKVASAKAQVEAAKVAITRTEIELQRQKNLIEDNATAQSEVDQAQAEYDAALATRDAAQAELDQAELNLQYTQVTTPIAGRVERTLVKRGNLVGDGEATHLTTVMDYDPIHVYFSISELALLRATSRERAQEPAEADGTADITQIKAYVRRAVDDGFPFEGNLDYADLAVDQSTGTFQIRAVFPNPRLDLFPGLFVRVRVPIGTLEDAVLIPERSVGADQAGRYVMLVVDDDMVERRNVELGAKFGEMIVVTSGLSGQETVIVDGIQRVRPGAKVSPQETELPPLNGKLDSVEEGGQAPDTVEKPDVQAQPPSDGAESSAENAPE